MESYLWAPLQLLDFGLTAYIHISGLHCPNTTSMDGGSADIAGANICPYVLDICITLLHTIHGVMLCSSAYIRVGVP